MLLLVMLLLRLWCFHVVFDLSCGFYMRTTLSAVTYVPYTNIIVVLYYIFH